MTFTHAIVCPPAESFDTGITSAMLGPPDWELAQEQHAAYCRTLEKLGLSLVRLPSDPTYPDGTFVEDAAVVTSRGAILTRPGAASRAGEVAAVEPTLRALFPQLSRIVAPGTVDGGDVCEAGEHFFIGVSERTNPEGAAQLAAWLSERGYSELTLDIRKLPGLLHLKTGLSWLGDRRLLAVPELARHPALEPWEVVPVPAGESYAANCVRINQTVLIAAGFPITCALLGELGYALAPLEMSEFRKMDGGLSCLSLRW
ncbi:MAG TPA: arginine deiminase family protein [Gemmatimonadales bacterium]|nr:arginine deiminase family protein [Gemmatimonadales bacterium]